MKNLSHGKKIALIISAIVLISGLTTSGVFGFKKFKTVKTTKAVEAKPAKKASK